jgi:hypothetical protein
VADVCTILFSSERDENSFVLTIIHMDEMENNDPSAKVKTNDVNENKKAKLDCVGFKAITGGGTKSPHHIAIDGLGQCQL